MKFLCQWGHIEHWKSQIDIRKSNVETIIKGLSFIDITTYSLMHILSYWYQNIWQGCHIVMCNDCTLWKNWWRKSYNQNLDQSEKRLQNISGLHPTKSSSQSNKSKYPVLFMTVWYALLFLQECSCSWNAIKS